MEKKEPNQRTQTDLTCPECRGPIWVERHGRILEYRCRVGHAYSPQTFQSEHDRTVERSLWASLLALEESAELAEKRAAEEGGAAVEEARVKRERAAALRKILEDYR